ncbi:Nuclear pore complex protein Nup98-Nup96 [Frankliniella fusca]|uniref:Nuclear pore complex protein Nup98-Nup96 n=1 Tax=Frankliniella fusca TaxID=407009 RepID=A0AAE1LDU4_9NEOP|nr:Nuclear pore complex protein Nup98-Nup96 [Frankliniella fusca]
MVNFTSNSLFIATGVLFVVGLLFLAYPILTLKAATLCGIACISYYHSSVSSILCNYYAYFFSVYWPTLFGSDRQPLHPSSNLLTGVDLPSPIPHVPSGLETAKNRRSPVDEIVSSTPRSTPTSSHGTSAATATPLPPRVSPEMVVADSRQLNFGRINSLKTTRNQAQEFLHTQASFGKLRNRASSGKMIQTTAGPLLSSVRPNPTFDAGLFVNVNSPGFTDRLVRCASDNSGLNWGHNNPATQQDRYNSVGLFPIVHLDTSPPRSLTARNSQKAPNSSVRVKIAPPVSPDQRQHFYRNNNVQMRPYMSVRKNEIAKSVLESLQEASRKRIYSQCQEVMEDESGKKRQRKGETALPNPNCDIYQYRHIRAPSVPSSLAAAGSQNDVNSLGKRLHEDPMRANEAKRIRHQVKPQSSNNEISSSLSSSKTLLQRLSGNKRKADCYDFGEEGKGKHFKESVSDFSSASTSRWLHSQTCEAGESAARTQEVLRKQKTSLDTPSTPIKKVLSKNINEADSVKVSATPKTTLPKETIEVISEKVIDKSEIDLTSKLFRKDVTRSYPKANQPGKKGSSWSQVPPDADERCLFEQESASDIDRPERFQSLLSRMSGQDPLNLKQSGNHSKATEEQTDNSISIVLPDKRKTDAVTITSTVVSSSCAVVTALSSATASVSSFSTKINPSPEISMKGSTSSAGLGTVSESSLTSLISVNKPTVEIPVSTSSPSASPSTMVKFSVSEKEGQSTPSSPQKPMFNFTPSNSQTSPRPVITQNALPTALHNSGITQPSLQFSVSPLKPGQDVANLKSPTASQSDSSNQKTSIGLLGVLANETPASDPLKPAAPFQAGFSLLPVPSQADATSLNNGSSKGTVTVADKTVTFMIPGQKSQLPPPVSSSFTSPQQLHVNGPLVNSIPGASSLFPVPNLNQSEGSETSSTDNQKTFGGFSFSRPSGSIFGGQPNSSSAAPSAATFSFTSASSMPVVNASAKNVSEAKSGSGCGSITFGTVATTVSQPTSAVAFNFSRPTTVNSVTETAVSTNLQLSNNSAITNSNLTLSGFTNTSQVSNEFFYYSGSSFGEGASQPPAFGSTTTTGFPLQTTVPPFKSSPFASATAPSGIPFGSPQQSNVSSNLFGGQTASNSASAFGLLSTFNGNSTSTTSTFGAATFGASAPSESTFGAGSTTGSAPTTTSAFTFGATSNDKPQAPTFNFGANSPPSAPAFNFGSNDQQPQNSSHALFQFGQPPSSNAAPAFQFGSPSAQPAGSGGFSMGTGPSTPQRTSRALQSRRRRI